MTTRIAPPVGGPCWIDLMTEDTQRSRGFYCDLFGWEAGEPDNSHGGYFMFTRGGDPIAGCRPRPADCPGPDAWSVYLSTDDATRTVEAATAEGSQVMVPAIPIADLGTMAVLTDPGGAGIGMWQPGTFGGFAQPGPTPGPTPGAPGWFELSTTHYDAAIAFYREVFGLDSQVEADAPRFRYTTLTHEGTPLAGIMDGLATFGEGARSQWLIYFGTEDTDATLARAVELGGQAVIAPADSPYGRLGMATDPTGAMFKLVGPSGGARTGAAAGL